MELTTKQLVKIELHQQVITDTLGYHSYYRVMKNKKASPLHIMVFVRLFDLTLTEKQKDKIREYKERKSVQDEIRKYQSFEKIASIMYASGANPEEMKNELSKYASKLLTSSDDHQ